MCTSEPMKTVDARLQRVNTVWNFEFHLAGSLLRFRFPALTVRTQ